MPSEFETKISEELGYIRGKVEGIDKSLAERKSETDRRLICLEQKTERYDMILGKAGLVASAVVFVLTVSFQALVDVVKTFFIHKP